MSVKLVAPRWSVDVVVDAVYRAAGVSPGDPPGIGKLAPKFFFPDYHTRIMYVPQLQARHGALSRHGDQWLVTISSPFRNDHDLAALGDVIARVIAHDAVLRNAKTIWSDSREQELADAIVFPAQAVLSWSDKSVDEIAHDLVTTVALVERRWRIAGPPSTLVRVQKPLAKAAAVDDDEFVPASQG